MQFSSVSGHRRDTAFRPAWPTAARPELGPEALLNAADQALLAAKQAGRNRVLLATAAATPSDAGQPMAA